MAEQNNGAVPPKVNPMTPHAAGAHGDAVRPITVHLRPITIGAKPGAGQNSPISPRSTSRVPLPEGVAPAPVHSAAAVKLEPSLGKPSAIEPVAAPVPGSHPLPPGPKPPSVAQVQASKSKTSRISLDSAIGAAPAEEHASPKTIRLKRPMSLEAPGTPAPAVQPAAHQTSRIPVEAALGGEGAPVTQRKTLKIKRTATADTRSQEIAEEKLEGLTPIEDLAPAHSAGAAVFTGITVAFSCIAAVVVILLCLCLGSQAMGPAAGKNSLATIPGPQLPWIGK